MATCFWKLTFQCGIRRTQSLLKTVGWGFLLLLLRARFAHLNIVRKSLILNGGASVAFAFTKTKMAYFQRSVLFSKIPRKNRGLQKDRMARQLRWSDSTSFPRCLLFPSPSQVLGMGRGETLGTRLGGNSISPSFAVTSKLPWIPFRQQIGNHVLSTVALIKWLMFDAL